MGLGVLRGAYLVEGVCFGFGIFGLAVANVLVRSAVGEPDAHDRTAPNVEPIRVRVEIHLIQFKSEAH